MTQAQLKSLLGRSLTPVEVTNLALYLEIAQESLDDLLCSPLTEVAESRIFTAREGYSTLFTDIFTAVTEVKYGDTIVDPSTYYKAQWDKRTGAWFNSLVFTTQFSESKDVTVTASWGLTLPADLNLLLARAFALISSSNSYDQTVSSKQVEDFRITFNNGSLSPDSQFAQDNAMTINKYSLCGIGDIQHGEV